MPYYYYLFITTLEYILFNGLHIDGEHRNVNGEYLKWPDTNENIYLQMLYKRVRNDPNNTPSFKTSDYQQMDEEIFATTGTRYGPDKLKAKYNCLRIRY